MAVLGWVLVQTEVGRARAVADAFATVSAPGVRIISSDTVTGPHDVIVHVEAESLDGFGSAVEAVAHVVDGIVNTITCLTLGTASA